MKKFELEAISRARLVLGNPYAHKEYLEEDSWGIPFESNIGSKNPNYDAGSNGIASQQKLSPNNLKSSSSRQPTPRTKYEIVKLVRGIQIDLWSEKKRRMNGKSPDNPIDVLDAEESLRQRGYSLEYVEGYAVESKKGRPIKVAGELDMASKKVFISIQFPVEQQRFTLAHELGHVVMHEKTIGLHHRDRMIGNVNVSNEAIEREANMFAVFFTMPEKLVKKRFKEFFNLSEFHLSPETVGALGFKSLAQFKNKVKSRRELSRLLVHAKDYDSHYFPNSLASEFKVSVESMAIRIEELGLVVFNINDI